MGNPVVHVEITGTNAEQLTGFYHDLFGWEVDPAMSDENYKVITEESSGVGAGIGVDDEGAPKGLTVYISVADIDRKLGQIGASGGKTVVSRTEIPNVVTYAQFTDPAGNKVGLVEV